MKESLAEHAGEESRSSRFMQFVWKALMTFLWYSVVVFLAGLCCVVLISPAQCLTWNNVVMIAINAGP